MSPKSGRESLNLIKTGGKSYFGGFSFIFIRRLPAVNVIGRAYKFAFVNVIGAYAVNVIYFAYIAGFYTTGAVCFNTVTAFNSFSFLFIAYGDR